MSGKDLRERAKNLAIGPKTGYAPIQRLICDGFLDEPRSSEEIVLRIRERFGSRWKTNHVQTYMRRFMDEGIVHAVKPKGQKINYWTLANVAREDAIRLIGKARRVREIEEGLFSVTLEKRLHRDFAKELHELRTNFGQCGNCTAFLLRKILEKLIIIVFGKNGRQRALEDRNRPGGWVGLREMTEIAAREKLHGVPFLTPKTASEIKGIKFLGDTAAHNPLVGVEITTILPQMPYIITAYEELAKRL